MPDARIAAALQEAADKSRAPSDYDAAAVKRLLTERDRLRKALEQVASITFAPGDPVNDYRRIRTLAAEINRLVAKGFSTSTRQRVAVMEHGCLVCRQEPVDPAHVIDKSLANDGDGDPRAVVPLCRQHHRAYDEGGLDILPMLERSFRPQLAYAVERHGLLRTLERVTNTRWSPVEEQRRAA